jgi:proteasome lid subunit RPN8/RPN11
MFVPQSTRISRLYVPAVPYSTPTLLAAAERPKRVKVLRSEGTEKSAPAAADVRILSSRRPPVKPDCTVATQLSYGLHSGETVTVRIHASASQRLISHCLLSSRHGYEVAGVLAGCRHESTGTNGIQYCLEVTDVLPIESQDRSGSHIRVDEKSWGSVERMLLDLNGTQEKCKLAWYHTHPTQGIFFSRGDWESHLLFARPYQFALVVDPSSMKAGLFYWSDYDSRLQGEPVYFSLKQETE